MVSSSELASYAPLLAILVLVVGVRILRTVQGAPLSVGRLVGFAVVYVLLGVLALGADALIEPWWVLLVEAAIVAVVALSLPPTIEATVHVYRGPGGGWHFKLGVWVLVAYLGLFLARIVIEIGVLGIDPFAYARFAAGFSTEQLALLGIVDGLFALSIGLLLARSVAIYRSFRRAEASEQAAARAPLA